MKRSWIWCCASVAAPARSRRSSHSSTAPVAPPAGACSPSARASACERRTRCENTPSPTKASLLGTPSIAVRRNSPVSWCHECGTRRATATMSVSDPAPASPSAPPVSAPSVPMNASPSTRSMPCSRSARVRCAKPVGERRHGISSVDRGSRISRSCASETVVSGANRSARAASRKARRKPPISSYASAKPVLGKSVSRE
mmetsp:Transcript_8003/g.26598  ORF Transcript_8003/g.26598 Transcript_8003/m.26598 type:complete len:200 (+) Transcript_8003:384-983(+)